MDESLCQFHAALHASGEGFNGVFCAVHQADTREHFVDAMLEVGAFQSVQMALVLQVLCDGELDVEAASLEDDPDLLADFVWLAGGVESLNPGIPAGGDHQR